MPEAIRIRIAPREPGPPRTDLREAFWAPLRESGADSNASVAKLEATLCREFGPDSVAAFSISCAERCDRRTGQLRNSCPRARRVALAVGKWLAVGAGVDRIVGDVLRFSSAG